MENTINEWFVEQQEMGELLDEQREHWENLAAGQSSFQALAMAHNFALNSLWQLLRDGDINHSQMVSLTQEAWRFFAPLIEVAR